MVSHDTELESKRSLLQGRTATTPPDPSCFHGRRLTRQQSRCRCAPRARWTSVLLLLATVLMGCASSRPSTHEAPPHRIALSTTNQVEDTIRSAMTRWSETPHRMGGMTVSGADCSGFVVSLYRETFGVQLPRTTREQARTGVTVRPNALQAGDLVFFRPGREVNHVGIYLSEGRFAHISTSRGFIVSHMDEPYWRRRFAEARRVIEPSAVAVSPRPTTAEPTPPAIPTIHSPDAVTRRGGW
jgi:cell wall-associated NlpC family hydrolase